MDPATMAEAIIELQAPKRQLGEHNQRTTAAGDVNQQGSIAVQQQLSSLSADVQRFRDQEPRGNKLNLVDIRSLHPPT